MEEANLQPPTEEETSVLIYSLQASAIPSSFNAVNRHHCMHRLTSWILPGIVAHDSLAVNDQGKDDAGCVFDTLPRLANGDIGISCTTREGSLRSCIACFISGGGRRCQ